MNLLVANTRNAQAYAIIRALRPYAEKIVVTMYGKNRLSARLSHAANSRLVDKRYYVPSPVEDWRAGNIGKENTEREEATSRRSSGFAKSRRSTRSFRPGTPRCTCFRKTRRGSRSWGPERKGRVAA